MLFSFFIGLLTVILVLDCLFLLLLVLIQLPKKEAGLGQAFGSSTTDALFGAGSGTALTKLTKYAAVVFFVLTFLLAIMNAQQSKSQQGGRLREALEKVGQSETVPPVTPPTAATSTPPVTVTIPPLNLTNPPAEATNLTPADTNVLSTPPAASAPPAAAGTNPPPTPESQ